MVGDGTGWWGVFYFIFYFSCCCCWATWGGRGLHSFLCYFTLINFSNQYFKYLIFPLIYFLIELYLVTFFNQLIFVSNLFLSIYSIITLFIINLFVKTINSCIIIELLMKNKLIKFNQFIFIGALSNVINTYISKLIKI